MQSVHVSSQPSTPPTLSVPKSQLSGDETNEAATENSLEWYQKADTLENWLQKQMLLKLLKQFQPNNYTARLELSFDNTFTSEHGVTLNDLLNNANLEYCKQFSRSLISDTSGIMTWNHKWNERITLYSGNVTHLSFKHTPNRQVSLVNASNESLVIGGGLNGTIYEACGIDEMTRAVSHTDTWIYHSHSQLDPKCPVGEIVVTDSFKLAQTNGIDYIIHTTGPRGRDCDYDEETKRDLLANCYRNSLSFHFKQLPKKYQAEDLSQIYSAIIFPCISTGKFHMNQIEACNVACATVRDFLLEENSDKESPLHQLNWRIIFCTFRCSEQALYETFMDFYFP
ncbi:hypothetical protein FDP41_013181 [Naegleria fowleri]|uniref:Macro domain-containing protein n=1 Tax=Naegleria fowleri TaxID=5763 RepID=A0A6A5C4B0_NAEFO|nr:uncharacterized protein FDP41_013181 [Naegleria fowleri]KAF0980698.1 hypothetical protein FDP41_013181 [Naegleria fowleri]CAG4714856.1 unnamed protein product [Naegleria fowleri]